MGKTQQPKRKTISSMTGTRRMMPPPVRADKTKKGKGSYNRQKEKKVDYK